MGHEAHVSRPLAHTRSHGVGTAAHVRGHDAPPPPPPPGQQNGGGASMEGSPHLARTKGGGGGRAQVAPPTHTLEEVAKAVGGGYCRLQMPLRLALGVRGAVAGRWLGALEGGDGGSPPFQGIPAPHPQTATPAALGRHPPPPPHTHPVHQHPPYLGVSGCAKAWERREYMAEGVSGPPAWPPPRRPGPGAAAPALSRVCRGVEGEHEGTRPSDVRRGSGARVSSLRKAAGPGVWEAGGDRGAGPQEYRRQYPVGVANVLRGASSKASRSAHDAAWGRCWATATGVGGGGGGGGRDALQEEGPQRRPQQRLDGRLEEVAKAVGGRLLSVTNAIEPGT